MDTEKPKASTMPERSPLDRTADLMRRVLQAKKPKAVKPKRRKRHQ